MTINEVTEAQGGDAMTKPSLLDQTLETVLESPILHETEAISTVIPLNTAAKLSSSDYINQENLQIGSRLL